MRIFLGILKVTQPKVMDQKISCAKHLQSVIEKDLKFNQKIFVDKMDGKLCKLFDAHPEKLVAIKKGKITFIGGKGPYKTRFIREENNHYKSCLIQKDHLLDPIPHKLWTITHFKIS